MKITRLNKVTGSTSKNHLILTNIPFTSIIVVGLLMCLLASPTIAQDSEKNPARGITSGASYSVSDIETINMTNGNLMVNLPLASLPTGRGDVGNSISLMYNSKLYDSEVAEIFSGSSSSQPITLQNKLKRSADGGWKYSSAHYHLRVRGRYDTFNQANCGGESYPYQWKVSISMPDGSEREFRPVGQNDLYEDGFFKVSPGGYEYHQFPANPTVYSTSGMVYYSTDGSYTKLVVDYVAGNQRGDANPWTMYQPDGSKIRQNSNGVTVTDRNGNSVQGYTDSIGRSISLQLNAAQNEDHITMTGANNEELKWKVKWKTLSFTKNYFTTAASCSDDPTTRKTSEQTLSVAEMKVVDRVTLPTQMGNLYYEFHYNTENNLGFGELSSITMPSGAISEYEYKYDIGLLNFTTESVLKNSITKKTLKYNQEYDDTINAVTEAWLYSISNSLGNLQRRKYSSVTSPNGSVSTSYFIDPEFQNGKQGLIYKTTQSGGGRTDKIWGLNKPVGQTVGKGTVNSYVKTEFMTIAGSNGNPSLTKITDYSIDPNGNMTEIKEYDWVAFNLLPKDQYGNPNAVPSGAVVKRITASDYYNSYGANSGNAYWKVASPKILNAVKTGEIKDGLGNVRSRTETYYDNANTTANPTKTKVWDSYKNGTYKAYSNPLTATNSIETSVQYDSYGNPTLTTDAKGMKTQLTYGAITTPTGTVSGLYPTETKSALGETEERTATATYDFNTGLVITTKDVDNNVETKTEYDDLGRPTKVVAAYNSSNEVWIRTEYDDVLRRVITRTDLEVKGDGKKVAIRHFDELGRARLARAIEDIASEDPTDEEDGIKVQTRYKYDDGANPASSNGVYSLSSNPYRATKSSLANNEETMGWTVNYAPKDGKYSTSESFSGASLPAPFGSNSASTGIVRTDVDANRTLVTDQAGKQRISKTNALGQLTDVWEVKASDTDTVAVSFPNKSSVTHGYKTSYSYDTLNNLTTVNQGQQTRTFTYSSLSRLKSANNPESGTISYVYDVGGNLTSKTDARSITTTYVYDNINRVTQRSYSDGITPTVNYTYDNKTNAIGQLTKVTNGISTTEYQVFDKVGRVTQSQQTTDGETYNPMTYKYNLSGAMTEQKYPSGRIVKNVLDNDGMLSMIQSKKNANSGYFNYAKSFRYNATGAVESMQLGNGKWESTTFNSRLQPTQIALGTVQNGTDKLKLDYEYNSSGQNDNNGNVLKQTIAVPLVGTNNGFTAVQTYTYDELNRLKSATENIDGNTTASWKQTFTYDRYGNRNFDEANTTTLTKLCGTAPNFSVCPNDRKAENPSISPINNRIIEDQDNDQVDDYKFDLAGNTTKDVGNNRFTYDGENKQIKVETIDANGNVTGTVGEYWYDGDGKRVKKKVGTDITIFVYNASGQLVADYSTQISETPKVSYLTNDHLGSPRITTDKDGDVYTRRDFMPFGEEIDSTHTSQRTATLNYATDEIKQKFTSYERDNETELDFAEARMYSSKLGRFMVPDIPFMDQFESNPQSWNLYSYVRNNPLKLVDPSGMKVDDPDFWEGLYNFFWYGYWVTDEEITRMEEERRTWFKDNNISYRDENGNVRLFDIDSLTTQEIFDFYKELKALEEDGKLKAFTAEEIASAASNAPIPVPGYGGTKKSKSSSKTKSTSTAKTNVKLTKTGRKKIGNLADDANTPARDVLKKRGGNASATKQGGVPDKYWGKPLGEIANKAAAGDANAETVIKLVKQAGTKAGKYKRKN